MQRQKGFTLIELVMVIVILGILASFAVPRFADITTDARKSAVRGLEGSVRSAAALAKATSIVQSKAASASISMEGASITMVNYYPDETTAGIAAALADTTGFTVATSGAVLAFTKDGSTTTGSCAVTYNAAPASSVPTITSITDGC